MELYGATWTEVDVKDIIDYFGERDIMCLLEEEFFYLEKTEPIPQTIRLDYVLIGKWYIKED